MGVARLFANTPEPYPRTGVRSSILQPKPSKAYGCQSPRYRTRGRPRHAHMPMKAVFEPAQLDGV